VANDCQHVGPKRCALHDPGSGVRKVQIKILEERVTRAKRRAAEAEAARTAAEAAQRAARKAKKPRNRQIDDFFTQAGGSEVSGPAQ
jgi:hypothetical protein